MSSSSCLHNFQPSLIQSFILMKLIKVSKKACFIRLIHLHKELQSALRICVLSDEMFSVEITAAGIEESRNLEKEGVLLAESGELDAAIRKFGEAIEKCSVNPSAYNNRAQALRLAGKPDGIHTICECQLFHSSGLVEILQKRLLISNKPFRSVTALEKALARLLCNVL